MVLEKTLESPLDFKEIKQVSPKGNQPLIFLGRIDAEVEAPILWPPVVKSWLTGKDPDDGKDWRQKEKGMAKDEMVSITNWIDTNLSKLWEIVKDGEAWHAAVHGVAKRRTFLSEWTRRSHYDPECYPDRSYSLKQKFSKSSQTRVYQSPYRIKNVRLLIQVLFTEYLTSIRDSWFTEKKSRSRIQRRQKKQKQTRKYITKAM